MCGEHRLMCGHGDRAPELLVSSKLTNPLDMADAGDTNALRREGLRTTLSQIAIRTEVVTEVKVSEETMGNIAQYFKTCGHFVIPSSQNMSSKGWHWVCLVCRWILRAKTVAGT